MFKYNIRGENIEVTEGIRAYVEKKIDKLARYFNNVPDATAHVNLKVYPNKQAKVEVTLPVPYLTLRAEVTSGDLYGSIDLVEEKLERQLRKYKTKINRRFREKGRKERQERGLADMEVVLDTDEQEQEDSQFNIVRNKELEVKPMDKEEAILQMNMLGHDFFIFQDVENSTVSVVYRRHDGCYGLLSIK